MPRTKKTETAPAAEIKAEVKTAEAPAEKPAKKPAAKTAKPAAPKETIKVQFGDAEYDFAAIRKAVEADYKAKFKDAVKTVEIYIKPEDKAAYYVINSDFSDKIEL